MTLLTLELPPDLFERVRKEAEQARKPIEIVMTEPGLAMRRHDSEATIDNPNNQIMREYCCGESEADEYAG